MTYTVSQPFNTPLRRFHAGDVVSMSDLDGPVSLETWLERGFLAHTAPAESLITETIPSMEMHDAIG